MLAEATVLGFKWIETRTRPSKYRGRIGIHASSVDPDRIPRDPAIARAVHAALNVIPHGRGVTRGSVVGSTEIVDCLPINPPGNEPKTEADLNEPAYLRFICRHIGDSLTFYEFDNGGNHPATRSDDITDQLPMGDFSDGRWAWILKDAKPVTERCPWCWGSMEDPDREEFVASDGTHVVRGCPVCVGGSCDPIPAKGQLGLWNWGGK
jgi:hypothetical protein